MPSINDSRKQVKATLPSIKGSEVTLWDELTVGDAEAVQEGGSDMERGIVTVFRLIKEWNLEEELTLDNVKKLSIDDFSAILKATKLGSKIEDQEDEKLEKKTA